MTTRLERIQSGTERRADGNDAAQQHQQFDRRRLTPREASAYLRRQVFERIGEHVKPRLVRES